MRHSFAVLSSVAIVLLVSSQYAHAQTFGDCRSLPDAAALEELIRLTFRVGDSPPSGLVINVQDFNYVCLVSGMFRGTYRKLSVVVSYDCTGSTLCPSASPVSQFDFTCNSAEMWDDEVLGTSEFSRTDVANADLTTPNRTNCSICISPNHPSQPGIPLPYDMITHCIACDAQCLAQGDMRCFGPDPDECCSFYDPHDGGKCLKECGSERRVTEIFDCAAYLRFSQTAYTIVEEDGTGSVMVEGTPGFEAIVVGGPNRSMADVRISGTDVSELITSPATVNFDINDDEVSIEVDEIYSLTLHPNDTAVIVMERMTSIIITDDVDRMKMGFDSLNYVRVEGNETGVRVRVNGENIRDYFLFYIQEQASPAPDIQIMFTVMFGIYSEADMIFPPIINPDDEIALQDERIYGLGLVILPEFVDDVELGAMIGSDQTFSMSNLTRQDNDVVTVSFDEPSYTVLEHERVEITLSLDRGIATAFTVVVRLEPTVQPPGLESSIPNVTYTVNFPVSDSLQSRTFTLIPVDDNVPNEPNEVLDLVFASISDPRVAQGDPAEVIIIDDDILAPLTLTFINDTPHVSEYNLRAEFAANRKGVKIICSIRYLENIITDEGDCSSGTFSRNFTEEEMWEQNTEKYFLHVKAIDSDTHENVSLRSGFRVFGHQQKYFCSLNMINTGTSPVPQGGSLEFIRVGKAENFTCKIDEEPMQSCGVIKEVGMDREIYSITNINLTSGNYTLIVKPTAGCLYRVCYREMDHSVSVEDN